jgi:hypothetical protein
MKRALVMLVAVLAIAGCGGKAKPADDPSSATCCCASGDGREVVVDAVCEERGGTCDPVETCEAADPDDGSGDGDSDHDDY